MGRCERRGSAATGARGLTSPEGCVVTNRPASAEGVYTMGSLGWGEILLIAIVVLLLFGARRLPEIGKGLGEGIRSFRAALKGGDGAEHGKEEGEQGGSDSGGGTK